MNKHTCVISRLAPDYEVCDNGDIFSMKTNWRGYGRRKMVPQISPHGYAFVRLVIGGKRVGITVHRLVVSAFLPPKPSDSHQVRHLDGRKLNNSASNFAWGTAKEMPMTDGYMGIPKAGNPILWL